MIDDRDKRKDQMDLFPDDEPDYPLPNARSTDPETSHLAAQDAKRSFSRGHFLVLESLYLNSHGLTDYELSDVTGYQQNSIGKRRGECMKVGLVTAMLNIHGNKLKRPAPSGSKAIVWCITPKGVEEYKRRRGQGNFNEE